MAMPSRNRLVGLSPNADPSGELLPLFDRESWMTRGACTGIDPNYDIFFPDNKTQELEAKQYCGLCPVAWECLDFSYRSREVWGIWGGMNFPERCDFTQQYGGHTSPTARAAHRRHTTELNQRKSTNGTGTAHPRVHHRSNPQPR